MKPGFVWMPVLCSLSKDSGPITLNPYPDLCLLVKKYKMWQQAEMALTTQLIHTCEHQMNASVLSLLINKIYTWQILLLFSFFGRTSFSMSCLNLLCPFHTNNSCSVQLNCTTVDLVSLLGQHTWLELTPFFPVCSGSLLWGTAQREFHLYIRDILMGHNRDPHPDMRAKMHLEYL